MRRPYSSSHPADAVQPMGHGARILDCDGSMVDRLRRAPHAHAATDGTALDTQATPYWVLSLRPTTRVPGASTSPPSFPVKTASRPRRRRTGHRRLTCSAGTEPVHGPVFPIWAPERNALRPQLDHEGALSPHPRPRMRPLV